MILLVPSALDVAADNGLSIHLYLAEPGAPAQEALAILASWTTSHPDPTTMNASAP